MRWEQFEALVAGKARMPEPGFSLALYYQVTGDRDTGRRAVDWALGPAEDLRQLALVFDWCQPLMSEAESAALAGKLQRGIETSASSTRVPAVRARVLAAVALADQAAKLSEAELQRVVQDWWRGRMVPALKQGKPIPREDHYALLELLHAVRDNTNIDLREPVAAYFKAFPFYQLLSYYPAPYPAPENEYRIPASAAGEADLDRAALSRAADLAMVAYESNAQETQYLQGWAMHDRFLMRSPFGIAYEFLWANPYQPGLSYYNVPLVLHDETYGRLFLRSSWDDDARWLGYFDGRLQVFEQGRPRNVSLASAAKTPIRIGEALVLAAGSPLHLRLKECSGPVFVVGLKPNGRYELEVDDEEMREERADPGGILSLPAGARGGIRLREFRASGPQ